MEVKADNTKQTHCALIKTTDMESELHLSRLGAITNARFAGVILVMLCVFSSRNNWRKLTRKSITRLLIVGKRSTMRTQESGSLEFMMHSLYISSGIKGSQSSRSHNFMSDART